MSKVQNFAGLSQSLPFTEFDFYENYRRTFESTELGRMKRMLPLHEMAESFGLVLNAFANTKNVSPLGILPNGEIPFGKMLAHNYLCMKQLHKDEKHTLRFRQNHLWKQFHRP